MKRSSRSLRENGTPRACCPGCRCRHCYPCVPTLGRATAAHLGFGCPKFYLRAFDPWLGRVVSGPRSRHHDGSPGQWFWDWLPDDMPHFNSITFHNDWAVVYMRHNVDSCLYVVSLHIDNKNILNLNLKFWIWNLEWNGIEWWDDKGWREGRRCDLTYPLGTLVWMQKPPHHMQYVVERKNEGKRGGEKVWMKKGCREGRKCDLMYLLGTPLGL